MSSVGLVREPVGHNLNLAVILAFISWVEPTLPVAATATCPFPRPVGEVCGRMLIYCILREVCLSDLAVMARHYFITQKFFMN